MKPVILGFTARCPHQIIIALDDTGCDICLDRVMLENANYPIDMIYVGKDGFLKKGLKYTIVGYVKEGKMGPHDPIPGLLLKATSGGAVIGTFYPNDFETIEEGE